MLAGKLTLYGNPESDRNPIRVRIGYLKNAIIFIDCFRRQK